MFLTGNSKDPPCVLVFSFPPVLSHEPGVTSIANGLKQLIESNAQNYWYCHAAG